MSSKFKKDAVRPRNCFFFIITRLNGNLEVSLGYKYADNAVTLYSTARRGAPGLKPPWAPPISCDYRVCKNEKGEEGEYFRFRSKVGEVQNIKVSLFNHLFGGENSFNRKCTSLCVEKKHGVLASYMTLLASSNGFTHHRPDIHRDEGIRKDTKGVNEETLKELGGSLEEFVEFREMACQAAIVINRL